jgi:hypothetical protein
MILLLKISKNQNTPNIIVNCTINNKNKDEIESLCKFITKIENIKGIFSTFTHLTMEKMNFLYHLKKEKKSFSQ